MRIKKFKPAQEIIQFTSFKDLLMKSKPRRPSLEDGKGQLSTENSNQPNDSPMIGELYGHIPISKSD